MITIKAYSKANSTYYMGMATQHRLALPAQGEHGYSERMPVNAEQFAACQSELATLAKHRLVGFEATDGEGVTSVTFQQVVEFFKKAPASVPAKQAEEKLAELTSQAQVDLAVEIAKLRPAGSPPPPAPWMAQDQSPPPAPDQDSKEDETLP